MKTFVIHFDTIDDRERFLNTDILGKHKVSEDDMETDRELMISKCPDEAATLIKESAKEYTGVSYDTCGGSDYTDCQNYEKKCGVWCEFCQNLPGF